MDSLVDVPISLVVSELLGLKLRGKLAQLNSDKLSPVEKIFPLNIY